MLCIDEIFIWTLDKNNTKARELPFGVVCSTALFGSTRHCMRLVIQSTVWVWKMWASILAVQLEMRFFQALTVNTVGVLDLQWKQLGHTIKPGATDKHQVLWRFFYLGFFWCLKKLGQVEVLPVGTDNPRKQNTIPSLHLRILLPSRGSRPLRLKFLRGLITVLHSMAHFTGHKCFEPGSRLRVSWTSQPHLHTLFTEGTSASSPLISQQVSFFQTSHNWFHSGIAE